MPLLIITQAVDLLNRMLTVDEAERIDIASIRRHPWFTRPMRLHLEEAIQKMEAEQAENERKVAAGDYNSSKRDKAVHQLLDLATSHVFREQVSYHLLVNQASLSQPGLIDRGHHL